MWGAGRVTRKLRVKVLEATPDAVAKISKAGGSVEAKVVDKGAVQAARDAKVAAERAKKSKGLRVESKGTASKKAAQAE